MTTGFKTLGSFHYFRTVDIGDLMAKLGPGCRFLADSGAYSALTQGAAIHLADYVKWLHTWKRYMAHYINLDVIGNPDATWRNQKAMEAEGLNPIPVFHAGSDFKHLYRYLDAGYTYICLGGLVGRRERQVMPWAIKCFKEARGKAVFHGLGLTRWADLAALPYYSVDSTTWTKGHRWAELLLWDDRRSRFTLIHLGTPEVLAHRDIVRAHGGDPQRLCQRKGYVRSDVDRISAVAWRKAENFLRRRHGLITRPGSDDEPGLHLYLVDASIQDLTHGAAGLRDHLATKPLTTKGTT